MTMRQSETAKKVPVNMGQLIKVIPQYSIALRISNGGFFLLLDRAIEVNRHFLEKEYGDLSIFSDVSTD